MNKQYLQKLILEIYDKEYELSYIEPSDRWKKLVDKATEIVEKCIKEGVHDD
ncbi:hypothetical protein [Lactobacillus sp. PV034]|uniref:hypothetical protein n=1 Tax=Lactobacillus sp. PV034 TaxID=2594495 RepID=UPI00223EB9EE|nr:hypothetical protein [Lactobacillus sp. PV034]